MVFGNKVTIILCLFYIIKALKEQLNKLKINEKSSEFLLHDFKLLYSIEDKEEFYNAYKTLTSYWKKFLKADHYNKWINYIENYWMCETWISTWTTWSKLQLPKSIQYSVRTNSLTERQWHAIKYIFLQKTVNYSMFNLVQILIFDVPAYYNHDINLLNNINNELNKKKLKINSENKYKGFQIFQKQGVFIFNEEKNIYHVQSDSINNHLYKVDLINFSCDCMSFICNWQCKHFAAVYYKIGLFNINREVNNKKKVLNFIGRKRNYKANVHGKINDVYPSFDGSSCIKKPGKSIK